MSPPSPPKPPLRIILTLLWAALLSTTGVYLAVGLLLPATAEPPAIAELLRQNRLVVGAIAAVPLVVAALLGGALAAEERLRGLAADERAKRLTAAFVVQLALAEAPSVIGLVAKLMANDTTLLAVGVALSAGFYLAYLLPLIRRYTELAEGGIP